MHVAHRHAANRPGPEPRAGEVGALPISRGAPPQQHLLRAVIAGEYHQSAARKVQLVEQVEQDPEVGVEFEQAVGPVTLMTDVASLHDALPRGSNVCILKRDRLPDVR